MEKLLPHITSIRGLKFRPTDQILVENFLYRKLHNLDYFRYSVYDYDLYGTADPWKIWELFDGVDGEDLYFFTQLKRSTTKSGQWSSHVNRKVGSAGGTWSAENSLTPVFGSHDIDQVIGYCKRLRYENPQMPEHHGEWIMHEYSLDDKFIQPNNPRSNYVLCRIRKNERVKRKAHKIKTFFMPPMDTNQTLLNNIASNFVSQQPIDQTSNMAPASSEQSDNDPHFETVEALERWIFQDLCARDTTDV